MSAIDSFIHTHVAFFFGLPVYWVLEENKMSNLTDFVGDDNKVIDNYSLVIGGGSGEHPALVINNDAVLFRFLDNIKDLYTFGDLQYPEKEFDLKLYQLSEKINNKYFNNDDNIYNWFIDKNQWPVDTFIRISKEFDNYSVESGSLESLIEDAVALFIIYEMPLEKCIKDPDLVEFAKMVRSGRWNKVLDYKEIQEKFFGFSGVLNCQKNGKNIKDGKTVWGYSLNDWLSENKEV